MLLNALGIVCILAAFLYYFLTSASIADPVRIQTSGVSWKAREHGREAIRFFAAGAPQAVGKDGGSNVKLTAADHLYSTPYWSFETLWMHKLLVQLPAEELERIEKLTVTVGAETLEATGDEVRAWPSVDPLLKSKDLFLAIPLPARTSSVPWLGARPLNWPGDSVYWRTTAQYALVPMVLLIFAIWRAGGVSPLVSRAETTSPIAHQGANAPRSPGLWNWTGVVFLIGSLIFLEFRDPYYFTQCDSLTECLPMILTGMRAFWQGDFPDYNPFLFGGSALAGLGVYGLTYPPLHLSYAIARHLLGNEFATIEVFVMLHLAGGFLLTRLLARQLSMSALPANLVALACVLSGASLIMGRSWFNFIPLTVWLPLTFLGVVRLVRGPVTWKWIVGMALVLGMPVHVGFSQLAMYIVGFFGVAVVWLCCCGDIPRRRIFAVLSSLVLSAAIATPLAYQQWLSVEGMDRPPADATGIAMGLSAMLLPYPLVEARLPSNWGNVNVHLLGHFYFFGGLLAWLFLFHLAELAVHRPGRREWAGQVWTVCAVVALWLGLGQAFGLWELASNLPVIGFISRHPLRLMPFIVFFTSIVGGLVLERLLRKHSWRRLELWIAVPALALLALHVVQCRTAFHIDRFTPYPALPAMVAEKFWITEPPKQVTGRVLRWGPHSDNEGFGRIMPASLAAAYELPSIEGTCALLENNSFVARLHGRVVAQPLPALRAYGIRWHLIQAPDEFTPVGTPFTSSWRVEVIAMRDKLNEKLDLTEPFVRATPAAGIDGIELYELPGTDPLAFACDEPARAVSRLPSAVKEKAALPLKFRGGGVEVDVSGFSKGQWITVNFLRRPEGEMEAFLDGEKVPHQADMWERIVVRIPVEGGTLAIRYVRPWGTGFLWALLPVCAGGGLMLVKREN